MPRNSVSVLEECIFGRSASRIAWAQPNTRERFEYAGLDISPQQIRLFRVDINSYGQAEGRLKRFTFDSAPTYRALSYTWGSADVTQSITINGKAFLVRDNLYHLLELYAGRHAGEYIWIDQICIAQYKTSERNHQVQLMSWIYRGAAEVLIWISPSQNPYQTCRIASSRDHWHGTYGAWKCDKLEHLLVNDYWKRVWIIQEILLSRSRRIFYGDSILTWQQLHYMADGNSVHTPRIPMQLFWLLQVLTSGFRNVGFADAIANCCQSECQDPRDKVYGLQGLLVESQTVTIDYHKSIKHVFIDAAVILPLCGGSAGGLLALARSMGIEYRFGDDDGSFVAYLYDITDWYSRYGISSRAKVALSRRLEEDLIGPELPARLRMPERLQFYH
jgi:hypothetical protein